MSSQEQASRVTAIKDQAVGAIKEAVGTLIGNEKIELKGKAQKVHGKNEMAYAKAQKHGDTEPHQFQDAQATHPESTQYTTEPVHQQQHTQVNQPHDIPMQQHQPMPAGVAPVPPQQPMAGAVPPLPPKNEVPAPAPIPPQMAAPPATGVAPMPHQPMAAGVTPVPPSAGVCPPAPPPPPANVHQHAEGSVEGDNVSKMGAMKDKTMGSIKETVGSATGNQNMELQGKAQNIHGHHQEEFAKAEKQGMNEPAHFVHGTNMYDRPMAEGTVEGQHQPSSWNAMKDQAMGSVKEAFGGATGNMNTEIAGKAQKIHGHNEAEFAKAQKEGLNEPAHYERGTKTTDHAQGEVVGEGEPSKMSGYKDQAIGAMKETWASVTGNQNMEIEGKAQKMQGSTECRLADEKKTSINA